MTARAWAAFAAVATLWGIPYLFIKLAVEEVSPTFVAWSRVVLGALVLAPLALHCGAPAALKGRWRIVLAYAVCEMAIPFPLISLGERHVSSSLTAILIAAVPLTIALLALRFDASERVTGTRLVGLLVGLGGVVALVGIDVGGHGDELLGTACILVATVGYAAGPLIYKRRLSDLDPRVTAGATLLTTAIVLAPVGLATAPHTMPSGTVLGSIAVLGVACSAAAFVLFNVLIAEVGAGRASVITYVSPIVAVALGITVLDERPGAGAIAGLLLILAGSWLSTDGRLPPPFRSARGDQRRARSPSSPTTPDSTSTAPPATSSQSPGPATATASS